MTVAGCPACGDTRYIIRGVCRACGAHVTDVYANELGCAL